MINSFKNELLWIAVQPTSYNYYFYSHLKRKYENEISFAYSLKEFKELPYNEKYYDSEDYFINEKFGCDFKLIKNAFSRKKIFLFCGWDGKTKSLCLLLRALLNLKYAIWMDSIDLTTFGKNKFSLFFKSYYLNKASVLFTTGKMGVSNLKKLGSVNDKSKIINLPYFNKIPLNYVSMSEKVMSKTFNILVLARLIDYKGVDTVIESLGLLEDERVHLYIGGIGKLEATLREKANKMDLQDRVHFCGFMNEQEIHEVQNKTHVFVHAARRHEPYGLVVIDSMAMAIPVIATSVTGAAVDRIVDGENGYLVEPNDAATIALRLRFLLKNTKLLIRMSHAARSTAEQWPTEKGVEIIDKAIQKYL